jgi:hypothetical protein
MKRIAGKSCLSRLIISLSVTSIRYDPLSSCLVDFRGRANVASVKNFQLLLSTPENSSESKPVYGTVDSNEEEEGEFVMQMGKVIMLLMNDLFSFKLSKTLHLTDVFYLMSCYDL